MPKTPTTSWRNRLREALTHRIPILPALIQHTRNLEANLARFYDITGTAIAQEEAPDDFTRFHDDHGTT